MNQTQTRFDAWWERSIANMQGMEWTNERVKALVERAFMCGMNVQRKVEIERHANGIQHDRYGEIIPIRVEWNASVMRKGG